MAEGGNPVPVQDWTAQDVKNHFEKIRMCGKFASQCESQNIEGSNLSELSQEDLINVLNLTLGEAKAVLKAINVLMPKCKEKIMLHMPSWFIQYGHHPMWSHPVWSSSSVVIICCGYHLVWLSSSEVIRFFM